LHSALIVHFVEELPRGFLGGVSILETQFAEASVSRLRLHFGGHDGDDQCWPGGSGDKAF
jgi:hypothetical protein